MREGLVSWRILRLVQLHCRDIGISHYGGVELTKGCGSVMIEFLALNSLLEGDVTVTLMITLTRFPRRNRLHARLPLRTYLRIRTAVDAQLKATAVFMVNCV